VKKELRHLKGLTRLGPVVCLTGPRRAERASGAQPHATVALTGCGERRGSQSATEGGEQTQELAGLLPCLPQPSKELCAAARATTCWLEAQAERGTHQPGEVASKVKPTDKR